MPAKRKRGATAVEAKTEEEERSPTPTPSAPKKRKPSIQYDPGEIIQELFETIRNYKSEEGKLLCESFVRAPNRRTAPEYYEVVSQPIDMIKIQQKVKTDEYEEIEQLTTDVELMVQNARSFYKKGSQEYIDATDLLDLYYEIRDELLVETFGETKAEFDDEEDDEDDDDMQDQAEDTFSQEDERNCDQDDLEQMFAAVVNATDGDREISPAFHLLPSRSLYPQYYEVIKEPIDLKQIAQKIQGGVYKSLDDIEKDLNLMVKNAKTFNEPKSLIFKDACTLKKIIETTKRELEHRKANVKTSERLRTRGSTLSLNDGKLSAEFAALEYAEPIEGTSSPSLTGSMEYDDDSGAETTMSEEENPMWNLYHAVRNYTSADGVKIIEPYMKLPSKRFYPDYYEEIKRPLSVFNVRSKLKKRVYSDLDEIAADLNLVFENAKKYNADESNINKNACLLQQVLWEKKKELEKFALKKLQDEEHSNSSTAGRGRPKKSLATLQESVEKKRGPGAPRKVFGSDEILRQRLWALYKAVFDYTDSSGRPLRQIFMFLPSKKDYPDYYKVITDPIDMSMIENKIKGDRYPSEYNLMADFDLMFKNAKHYNEEGSVVYNDAITLEKALKAKWRAVCHQADPKKTPKTSKSSGSAMRGRQPTTLSGKLLDLYESIRDHQDARGRALSSPFMKVPSKSDYPTYYEVIKKPIDMSHIQQKMLLKKYESVEDMVADFVQMFDNACKYNEPDSLIYKDALTLQRLCLEKKVELVDDWSNEVPDIKAALQEMMTSLFISTYNHQDEEGRCYSDSFSELPERDPDADPNDEKPLTFDKIKRNVDRRRYRRLDRFQEDMFKVFERARRLTRTDSQLYEDSTEMQLFFIKTRDELCKNGEVLLTPALSYTERHLQAAIEIERMEKAEAEQREDEEKKKGGDSEETPQDSADDDGSNSIKYKDNSYSVGDFVYIEPSYGCSKQNARKQPQRRRRSLYSREPDSETPHIMVIEKFFIDKSGQQQIYGNYFYRPSETFHLATRKFLQKEVFKSDFYTSISPSEIIGKCYVMHVRDYFKYKPEGFDDKHVYVCEFRYNSKMKCFKKIKHWAVPVNEEINFEQREVPLVPLRVASVFANKEKEDLDDGDTSVLEKFKPDVRADQMSAEGYTFFEQINIEAGCIKIGDDVYVRSDQEKPAIYRIEKLWIDASGQRCFFGPMFVRPHEIEHPPTRLFYKNEVFACAIEDSRTLDAILGRCVVLHYKDYCHSRPTEIPEHDIFICESKYHEGEKNIRKLSKGLKKYQLSPQVIDDEIYFFKKPIVPHKEEIKKIHSEEPSPLLAKASEESLYDGEESRDTFMDASFDHLNTSIEETPVVPEKTSKRGRHKRMPSGFLLFSGQIRKQIGKENEKYSFGEISRIVGIKWRNLEKEEKEKYEEKAKRIAEEQQAKQEAAEKAFNESLTRSQSPWSEQTQAQGGAARPTTPGNQGFPGYYPGYNGFAPPPGQYPVMPPQQPGQQQQHMAPPPAPPRPPSPMFVTVPQRTQRLLHSEAYLKYIEGLNADSRTISDWDKNLSATQENTLVPDESRLPTQWLAQGAGNHGTVTDALWALRDLMLKDALNIQRTLPFEAL